MTQRLREELLFIAVLAGVMGVALYMAAGYPFNARLMPQVVAIATLVLLSVECVLTVRRARASRANATSAADGKSDQEPLWGAKFRRTAPYLAWLAALYLGIYLIGLMASAALFCLAFCRLVGKMSWPATLIGTVLLMAALFGLTEAFNMRWPVGYFFDPFR
ncbi:tripartite tricarboxylate transporter TctB family protein [Halomonas alkalisoli]|uniref:tripartite tricarboxylate transporter TctB family protein n=1 Tax=Halomonas alkalisoli TaxID=2907158 RepID=UPI001F34A158|nr:tripartite tricarboxylate transporter TctB family protein [Halomonas alkalisoli]MCE9680912.1 tripartite tricarboxylate transporter TctB family protein [Halomonas alkalisoli]